MTSSKASEEPTAGVVGEPSAEVLDSIVLVLDTAGHDAVAESASVTNEAVEALVSAVVDVR